jgi:hypothetical protein
MKDDCTSGCDVKANVLDDQKGRQYDVFEEVTIIAHYLRRQGVSPLIEERVRFARRRFGHYDLIDFVIVLLGYAISGERTLEAFYECLQPSASPFMALFGRERLPHRSTLSRFLAALEQAPGEALRTVFLEDLLSRPLEQEGKTGGMWDRQGNQWVIFDVDGTRQASRQRALPSTAAPPPVQRRLDQVCAPGYLGRKRGETVRTRTTVLQAHMQSASAHFRPSLFLKNVYQCHAELLMISTIMYEITKLDGISLPQATQGISLPKRQTYA